MRLSRTTVRILVWGPVLFFVLALAPFLAAFLEARLLRSSYVENVFRWLGVHDGLMRLRDWLAL